MKTILIPTDFSESSVYGMEFAANLARKNKAQIHLYNAAETSAYYFAGDPLLIAPPAAVMIEGINENLKKAGLAKLEHLKKRKIFSGNKVTATCEPSTNAHGSILDYAHNIKADIIIMGTKGASSIKGVLLGSTAERVVRFSERPVLVVPFKIKKMNPSLIIFASDFTKEAYGIFPFVQSFAKIFRADIHLLKINTADKFYRTKDDDAVIGKFNAAFGGKYKSIVYNDYMKEEGILNYADEVNADMIAIGTHGKKGLRRFFSEDVSEGIVRLAHKPILVVNLKKFKRTSDIIGRA